MNNEELVKVWNSRIELRKKAKELSNKGKIYEEESLKLRLESQDIKTTQNLSTFLVVPSMEKLISIYGDNVKEKLEFHECYNNCIKISEHLKSEAIKIAKEIRDIITKSDDMWIKAVVKLYDDATIEWFYDDEKMDFGCKLQNGETYLP